MYAVAGGSSSATAAKYARSSSLTGTSDSGPPVSTSEYVGILLATIFRFWLWAAGKSD